MTDSTRSGEETGRAAPYEGTQPSGTTDSRSSSPDNSAASVPLPERYWPRNGTDVTWCPDVLRSWLEMHRRAGAGNPDPTISAGVALFLLDHWEATRDAE